MLSHPFLFTLLSSTLYSTVISVRESNASFVQFFRQVFALPYLFVFSVFLVFYILRFVSSSYVSRVARTYRIQSDLTHQTCSPLPTLSPPVLAERDITHLSPVTPRTSYGFSAV